MLEQDGGALPKMLLPLRLFAERLGAHEKTELAGVISDYHHRLTPWIKKGATHITVTTIMFTTGSSHSEVEIPEILDHLRPQYPRVELRYA